MLNSHTNCVEHDNQHDHFGVSRTLSQVVAKQPELLVTRRNLKYFGKKKTHHFTILFGVKVNLVVKVNGISEVSKFVYIFLFRSTEISRICRL